jgi:hypothetical protein
MLKKLFAFVLVGTVFSTCFLSNPASAVVTYANCPTLAPLPVTSFMPAAMLPIEQAEMSFDIGMNTVVTAAIQTASVMQLEAINSAFNTLSQQHLTISQAGLKDIMEIERAYEEMMLSYDMELESQKEQLENMLFPGDSSMLEPDEGEERVITTESPTYRFVAQMCSGAKMQQKLYSDAVINEELSLRSRRNQKIISNIQAVASIDAMAKQSVDFHYDVFCSQTDKDNGICDSVSLAPNADLDAYVLMYPSGYRGEGNGGTSDDYQTMYTYSPVESLAAYQFIKNLTGTLYFSAPTSRELDKASKSQFVGLYKQMVSGISLSTDTMLSVAALREPINSVGLIVSKLDAINYTTEQSKLPEHQRIMKSASQNGKLLELQKQLALQNQWRLLILKMREKEKQLKAARVAMESSVYSLQD